MNKHSQHLVIALPAIALLLASQSAFAEIYKWRDHFGRTQYSDRPPVVGFAKTTRNDIVNALQKKELCALPIEKIAIANSTFEKNATTKTDAADKVVVASTQEFSADFFGSFFKKRAAAAAKKLAAAVAANWSAAGATGCCFAAAV